jgi:adenylate cyclase
MRAALKTLNEKWEPSPDRARLSIGIGVNHGEVIVGNVGHPQRMEFTVLGDGVNLTARLESATRQFYTDILIGEETEKLTRQHFIYRHVGAIAFKGKSRPVETFFVLSAATQPAPTWLAAHHEAIQLYRAKQFAAAAARFQTVQQEIGAPDHLCSLYISQCELLAQNPPPTNWEGAFTLNEK